MPSDSDIKKFKRIFQSVAHATSWKFPTKPITVKNIEDAKYMMEAISYFAGGAELKDNKDGTYTITSMGYYHYIGA